MILKLSDTKRFFESKGVDAGFCRVCGSRQIKIYGDVIESETDKMDANISVIMSNVLDSNASLK